MYTLTPVRIGALDTSQFSDMANRLASLVQAQINRGLGISFDQACEFANAGLDPDQKLYEVEINQTALILNEIYPQAAVDAWLIHLRNNMGYRITQVKSCYSPNVMDPITRECMEPQPVPIPTPEPQPVPLPHNGVEAGLFGNIDKKWLYLGGVLALLLLFRR